MNVLLDIFGSTVIAGAIFLLMMNFRIFSTDAKISSDAELHLQMNTKTFAEILDYDLRKVGYNYEGNPIITAEKRRFSYWADTDRNGSPEIVVYYLGDSTEVPGSPNPRDKFLYCVVGSDTSGAPTLGIVDVQFTYRNSVGVVTANPTEIKYIEVGIWTQSPYPVNKYRDSLDYLYNYWQLTVNPRNL